MTIFLPFGAGEINTDPLPKIDTTNNSEITTALSIVFGCVGALAVLYIVIAGFRYILARGDPGEVSKAKSGIIYALIGLAISLSAELIVNYVIGNL